MDKKNVSIIIRSHNEEKWIAACLQAVFKQDYRDFEVILIDNKSSDKTVKKAQAFPVKIVSIDNFLPGKAINIGIENSTGKYVVCLSAHCIPVDNCWLSNLLKDFDDDKVAGVYGRQEPMAFTSDTDKRDLITVFGLDRKVQFKDSFFHNANSMFRRDVWGKIPFDENISNIEDRIWARDVLKAGYKIIYEPDASVYHWHGIHQNQNLERCTNVVKIIENLNGLDGRNYNHLQLKDLNILALIPVKGESCMLGGRSLLEYAINSVKESQFVKQIVVYTDSDEHADLARKLGANVPFMRDSSLSAEHIGLENVFQQAVLELENKGIMADIIVTLEVTFPFRPKGFIDQLIIRLVKEGLDSVVAARTEFGSCWVKEPEGLKQVDSGFVPRKFKEPVYVSIKGLACATHPQFLREGRLLGEKVGIVEINDPYASIEVRDEEGLRFAGLLVDNWSDRNIK